MNDRHEADHDMPEGFPSEFLALYRDTTAWPLILTRFQAWCLLSAVQLASRHPQAMSTRPMRVAVEITRHIQAGLELTPALADVAERGWDRTQDRGRERHT